MGFYRADLRGTYEGQLMQNTLYYRDRDPFSGDLIVQSELLGSALNAHFFPALSALLPAVIPLGYHWDTWAIMPLTAVGFEPALATPVLVEIDRDSAGDANALPPGNVVIISFILRNGPIGSGLYQPRRSYIAVGPVAEPNVQNDGRLNSGALGGYNDLADLFAENVGTVAGVGGWAPVRYGNNGLLQGFAELDGAAARPVVSYRKSRQPES